MTTAVNELSVLSDVEQYELKTCLDRIEAHLPYNQGRRAYYEAHQEVKDLGIAVPPHLKRTMTAVGWPGLVVDSLDERLDISGIVIPGGDAASIGADVIWAENELDLLYPEAHIESLIQGVAFLRTSVGGEGEPEQLITIESPTNMSGIYDPRRRELSCAASIVRDDEGKVVEATLYRTFMTVHVARGARADAWTVTHREEHDMPRPLVRRLVNRPRGSRQWGRSEITRPIISYTQSAARTLLGAEVSREFYNAPQRWVMGANEEDFRDENGQKVSPWKSYMGRILALSADEETGVVPSVGQFPAASPQPYIDLVRMYSQLVAGEAGLPAHYLGFVTDNPASADQIRAVEARHVKRAERRQKAFGAAWRGAILDAITLRDGAAAAQEAALLRVKWNDAATPTKAAAADATLKMVQAGVLPADSDVVLEGLGHDEVDIARIRADRRAAGVRDLATVLRNRAEETRAENPPAAQALTRRVPQET